MISKTINSVETSDNQEQEKVSKDVYLIAQEIKIVKSLASNDLNQRTKQLKKLKKWLSLRSNSTTPFEQEDFLRIWKGLFYCMWMSDKPLVQESLAEDLGSLLDSFSDPKISSEFFGAFLQIMCLEWFGIDQWRIDKFLMLVRRMLRHMFQVLKNTKWDTKVLKYFNKQFAMSVLQPHDAIGLSMHVIDIYLEELAKVSDGSISNNAVAILVKPYIQYLATQKDMKVLSHLRNNIFYHLLWQSEMGREYTEKFNAWKMMGFPTANINDLEKVEEESVEETETEEIPEAKEKILDPRAGKVDVEIPEVPVNVEILIKEFESLLLEDITNTKSRRCIRQIIDKYKRFQSGYFPLGVKRISKPNLPSKAELVKEKVAQLEEFEDNLLSTTRKLKQLSKKNRKRLLSSITIDDTVNEENFEEMLDQVIYAKRRTLANGWEEEDIVIQPIQDNGKLEIVEKKPKKGTKSTLSNKIQNSDINNEKSSINKENSPNVLPPKFNKGGKKATIYEKKSTESKKNTTNLVKKSGSYNQISITDSNMIDKKTEDSPQHKVIKTEINKTNKSSVAGEKSETIDKWNEPLKEGELEYFIKSKKSLLKDAKNTYENNLKSKKAKDLVINPFATNLKSSKTQLLGKGLKKVSSFKNVTPKKTKKVKIALQKNMIQNPHEYIQQVKLSPNVPYDSKKQPTKSLLKPNLMPSPINPFYMKKIALQSKLEI